MGQFRHTLFVAAAALCLGAFTLDLSPWSDDARFYVPAARSYAQWFADAGSALVHADVEALSRSFSQDALDTAFKPNHEHPPFAKYLMGASYLVFHQALGLVDPVSACRLGVVGLWAMAIGLIFLLVASHASLFRAYASVGFFLCMPRLFFHAHAETLDMPVLAMIVACAFAAIKLCEKLTPWRFAATSAVFGCALATKLNVPFALVAIGLWALWERQPRRTVAVLGASMVLGVLISFAMWPWMYFDTAQRLAEYITFHTRHYPIAMYYLGGLYKSTLPPWHAPWVMAAVTIPLTTLAFAAVGIWRTTRCAIDPGERSLGRLALLITVVQIGALSLPNVPVYGGEKLFLPAFAFIAILAGLGLGKIQEELTNASARVAILALLLAPGFLGLVAYRGSYLSYFGEWFGGARGGAQAGMENQYYDLAYPDIASVLNEKLPNGGCVAVLPNPREYNSYFERWQRLGVLGPDINPCPPEQARFVVLTHERRWPTYPELLARYRNNTVVYQRKIAGVPLFSVFDTARNRAE